MPSDRSFSLPANRYLSRHHFPPPGVHSRYRPRSSASLVGLVGTFALRINVSVSTMGVTPEKPSCYPQTYPRTGVASSERPRTTRDTAHEKMAMKLGVLGLHWTASD